jgi:hypothetical protein
VLLLAHFPLHLNHHLAFPGCLLANALVFHRFALLAPALEPFLQLGAQPL